jgi:hypothetical protein
MTNKFTTQHFIEKANKIHNNFYDYSKVTYINTNTEICIIDPEYGEFWLTPKKHLLGVGNKKRIKEKRKQTNIDRYGVENPSSHILFKEKRKQTNIDRYGVEHQRQRHISEENLIIFNDKDLFTNFMKDKTVYEAAALLGYTISPIYQRCAEWNIPYIKYEPQWEIDLSNWLTEHNINHTRNDREQIKPQEIDIYLSDYNIGIELCGLYWHSDLYKDKHYHYEKYKLAKNNGIRLIQIFEDEWVYKKEAVLNRLKNKLKLHEPIYARQCIVKEIDHNTSTQYINMWHTQGNASASVRLGLYYQDKLVQVMTFGKGRFRSGWELIRLVSEKPVIGGANKLFKYFINKYKPDSVHSYCDLRWGNGDIYKKMGFDLIKQTEPDYFYVSGDQRINRIKLQNHKLTKEQRKERDHMSKIYGVGHGVWEKK